MPSPFPGMDPYLEDPAFWQGFHRGFITYLRDAIYDHLPERYDADLDETMRVVLPDEPDRMNYPDVAITGDPDAGGGTAVAVATAVGLQTVTMPAITDEIRDVWLEIRHRPDRDLVTVIEVLSPANKVGAELMNFANRRARFLDNGVHYVELNLLTGGKRPPLRSKWPKGDYYALIARGDQFPKAGVLTWGVRDPLPTVPIPLRAPDPDVLLDLAPVLALAYDRGRYARKLRYADPPPGPFAETDAAWIAERVAAARPAT